MSMVSDSEAGTAMAAVWGRSLVLVPGLAAGAAAGWVAGWAPAVAAAAAASSAAIVVLAMATRAATERFLAQVESPVPDERELALARRVGLDLASVLELKAAVKAAVRETMARRVVGLAAIVAPQRAAAAGRARDSAGSACPAAADSEAGLSAAAPSGHARVSDGENRDDA